MSSTDPLAAPPARLLHSIPEACAALGSMSRATFYREAAAGRIRIVKIGSRSFVTADELRRFVDMLPGDSGDGEGTADNHGRALPGRC